MDAQKRKNIVYILFVLAVIFGFYNLKDCFDQKKTELPPASIEQTTPQIAVLPAKTINIEEYSKLAWGRDPFYRAIGTTPIISVTKTKQIEWILNGILYDDQAPAAVINKKIVRLGDKINGAEIIEITKTKVILKNNSDTFSLHITKDKS